MQCITKRTSSVPEFLTILVNFGQEYILWKISKVQKDKRMNENLGKKMLLFMKVNIHTHIYIVFGIKLLIKNTMTQTCFGQMARMS